MSNRSDLAREIERNTEQRNEQRNRMREQQQAELTELGENYRNSYKQNMNLMLESTATLATTAQAMTDKALQPIIELEGKLSHLPTTAETLINQALQPIDKIRNKVEQKVEALELEQDNLDSLREKLATDRIKVEKAKIWLFYPLIALAIVLIILILANLWLGKSIQGKQQELAEIQQNIEQTPIQAQALAKVTVKEWVSEKGGIVIIPKNAKKAEWDKNGNDQYALFIKK